MINPQHTFLAINHDSHLWRQCNQFLWWGTHGRYTDAVSFHCNKVISGCLTRHCFSDITCWVGILKSKPKCGHNTQTKYVYKKHSYNILHTRSGLALLFRIYGNLKGQKSTLFPHCYDALTRVILSELPDDYQKLGRWGYQMVKTSWSQLDSFSHNTSQRLWETDR